MLLKAKVSAERHKEFSDNDFDSWPLIPIHFLPEEILKRENASKLYETIKAKSRTTLFKYFSGNEKIDSESQNVFCRSILSKLISLMHMMHPNRNLFSSRNKIHEQVYESRLKKLRESAQTCARGYDDDLLEKEINKIVNELNYKFLGIEDKDVLVFLTNPIVLEDRGNLYYFRPAKIKVYLQSDQIDEMIITPLTVTNKKRRPKKAKKTSKSFYHDDDDEDENEDDDDDYNYYDEEGAYYPHVDEEGYMCTGDLSTKYGKALRSYELFNAMTIINDGLFSWHNGGAYAHPSSLYDYGYLKIQYGFFEKNTVLDKMHLHKSLNKKAKDERNKIVMLFYQAELDGYNIGHCKVSDVKKHLLKKQVYDPRNINKLKGATRIKIEKLKNQSMKNLPKIKTRFNFDETYLSHDKLYGRFIEEKITSTIQSVSIGCIQQGLLKLTEREDILCVANIKDHTLLILFNPKKKLNIESRDISYILGIIISFTDLNIYVVSNFQPKKENKIEVIHPFVATGELIWGSAEVESQAAELFFNNDYSGLVDLVIQRLTNYDDTALMPLDLFDKLIKRGTWR